MTFDSPEGWIALLRERAFRTAYWPLPDDAPLDEVDAYAAAAAAAGISIAEVGAWLANPLSRDDAVRAVRRGALPGAARARRPRQRPLLREHRRQLLRDLGRPAPRQP